nr:replication endonuclease [Pseudoalteromonas sp.]
MKRYSDNRWWLRRIRKLINQANEKAAILLNFVNSKRQIYASDVTTRNRIAQHTRNENLLSSTYILNEQGQRYSLKEISDLNVSNPKIRKDELLCRARGFENLAKDLGHEALFITVTCPSKYHRAFSKSGAPNPKWQGLIPDQANSYLNQQWQKARSEFKRQNIAPYGFRVAEPQHDGTPHWHMLFFIESEKLDELKAIIRHYALEVDGDEKGAAENRCDFKQIDPNKGSATGYILKYIAKNIDGEGVGEDKFGNDSLLVAQRIDAWASCWCIRQFQQIGGASVSVWRELRRLRSMFKGESNSLLEKARFVADNSDWQAYTKAMGGLNTKSKDRPIKLHYDFNVNEETGECSQSYYDGELIQKVKGLWFAGRTFVTRFYQWRLEKA